MEHHDYHYKDKKRGIRRMRGQSQVELIVWRLKHALALAVFSLVMIGLLLIVLAIFAMRVKSNGL